MVFHPTIAWKASPRAHRRRFARPPRSLNRAGLKSRERRERLRDTSCLISRNVNDSSRVPAQSSLRSLNRSAATTGGGKVLNLCTDSKCRTAVIFCAIVQNKFIIYLCLIEPKGIFEQPITAMPISDYASAFFFVRRTRVTLGRAATLRRRCDCFFKTLLDQSSASYCGRQDAFPKPASLHGGETTLVKIRMRKNRACRHLSGTRITKRKSPALPGF